MKFESTIQALFNEYPSLFSERNEVLNHLFCVIGNGFEWKNGELVDDSHSSRLKNIKNKDVILKGDGKALQTIEDPLYQSFTRHFETGWYPLCDYSYLFDFPDDIKDDWKDGIEETKKCLNMAGVSTNINDYK